MQNLFVEAFALTTVLSVSSLCALPRVSAFGEQIAPASDRLCTSCVSSAVERHRTKHRRVRANVAAGFFAKCPLVVLAKRPR